jgi:hypothetical protein
LLCEPSLLAVPENAKKSQAALAALRLFKQFPRKSCSAYADETALPLGCEARRGLN